MATVYRDPRARTKINYITTAPFDLNFYNYTQSTNPNTFEVTGALSAVSGVSPSVCPKGRVLRENGKRLFPGGSYPGISTFMVGVFDANSGLSGYIDPNAEVFAYYNVDKPVEVVDGVDPSGNVLHRGPSVYTSGNILADGSLKVGGTTDLSGALTVGTSSSPVTTTLNSALILGGGTNTSAFSNTSGTVTFTPSTQTFYKLTQTNNVTALNCTTLPTSGRIIVIIYAGNFTVTPNTGFSSTTGIAPSTGSIAVTYVSNGTVLVELARQASTTNAAGPV